MNDLSVIIELILLLALPFVPIAVGVILRRKFSPAPAAEGAEPVPRTGAQKAGRLAGNILFWGGILGILFMIVVALNFKGYL
ncbi:MAG: hypothetical protein COX65_08650 [Elusimicrobia bacterium CG_4_10_14_0_2_um_filter_56_8]|nr:MAG: hypothetical protein AUJ51_03295 [Elusimicrobia bacterium CG1_02_56_21]PJA12430.1 MAG: hypothetical protein COX65_08650 [Elusimicrobia bacterium CG_4_10_14_0_2_um_filter_56_8]